MNRMLPLMILAAACSREPAEDPACRADALEPDIMYAAPLAGPGVAEDGTIAAPAAGKRYAISSTYLRQKRDEPSQKRFQTLMAPMAMQLSSQPGLVALQLSFSEKCLSARTLTVWQDEAAMVGFVMSDSHQAAIAAIGDVSRGGSIALHWLGSEQDATWDKATAKLGAHAGAEY